MNYILTLEYNQELQYHIPQKTAAFQYVKCN